GQFTVDFSSVCPGPVCQGGEVDPEPGIRDSEMEGPMIRLSASSSGHIRRFPSAALFAILSATFSLTAAAQNASVQSLGQMTGSMRGAGTFANAISADGSTIVGYAWVCPNGGTTCTSSGKTEAFRWTVAGKYQVLGDLGSSVGSMALATSSDGSVI